MIMVDLRVLIVAANPLARSGLAVLVDGMTGMKIVGATGVAEAASLAGQLLPDAVLLDAGEGEAEELDAIARLATAQPGLPIVALASDHGAVAQALTFGASALLPAAVDGETRPRCAHRRAGWCRLRALTLPPCSHRRSESNPH
jgi:two-component system, NarL family, nitrate/nitrite response regulator NarL